MGVRGLTTFIKNQEKKYLKNYKLHNCKVLLDGNSVASNLFIWSNIESSFGGDYDKYAKYVKEFFKVLKKCEISPLVIFDGGYEHRKLKTVYSRMRDKLRSTSHAQHFKGSINFPLFMRIVFREVLTELDIPFTQSDFEADNELAALARQLQCPVLSYDSDFYIYDVLYIPLPSLYLEPVAYKNTENSTPKYYLDCKIYNVDLLLESFGGLDKSMLPLLAALLGNDYIKRSVFKAFYANLKIPNGKTSPLQRRIKAVIEWLRKENFESGVKKILGRMKKNSRIRVMRQLKKIVHGYVQCTSVLSEYLMLTDSTKSINSKADEHSKTKCNIANVIEQIDDNIEMISEDMKSLEDLESVTGDSSHGEEGSSESEHTEDDCFVEDATKTEKHVYNNESKSTFSEDIREIPDWLLDYARKGKIQSCVIDIISLKQYFFPPQVEDHSLHDSHFISIKILSAIVGLLMGRFEGLVKYWIRNDSHLDWYTVEPIHETTSLKFPPCGEILAVSEPVRISTLLEAAEISIDLTLVPEEWHLFIIAILYWIKNMKPLVASEIHLHTMVMCLVAIFTIDSQIGIHRNKQTFTRKYKNLLNKIVDSRSKEKKASKESDKLIRRFENNEDENNIPKMALANISREDCILMFETILPYHHLSEQIKTKPKLFCISTVHAFAQFQSCLFNLIVFNSVLGFPLKEAVVSRLYSGMFAYNMYTNLSKRNNIKGYVETLFQSSPSLLKLYKSLIRLLEHSLTGFDLHKQLTKAHKKKKKQNKQTTLPNSLKPVKDDEDSDTFIDVNNVFSRLSLNT